jgi:hypothetical protein
MSKTGIINNIIMVPLAVVSRSSEQWESADGTAWLEEPIIAGR